MNSFLATLLMIGAARAAPSPGCGSSSNHDATAKVAPGNVVEVAVGNDAFSTLVAAVKAGGLVETLSGVGPFTVFAPTNDAFAALPEGTLDFLLKPENKDTLVAILTRHVAIGQFDFKDVPQGSTSLKTANPTTPIVVTRSGDDVSVSTTDADGKTATAKVIIADVEASNGVIHAINAVV